MSIKILQVASEASPLVKSGGLADVVSGLSQALNKSGQDCRVVLPKYSFLDFKDAELELEDEFNFQPSTGVEFKVSVYRTIIPQTQIILYLIYTSIGLETPVMYPSKEDGEQYRFIVFNLAVYEWLKRFNWQPDVIHAHDWMCGYLLKLVSDNNLNFKTVCTIHNSKYQGEFELKGLKGFIPDNSNSGAIVNLLKMGLLAATKINTVSPTFAKEIHHKENGFGIEEIINQRTSDVSGILNGLDLKIYTTQNNPLISPSFTADTAVKNKLIHKRKLLDELGLKDNSKPLFAVVGRTGSQKGMDVLVDALSNSLILDRINLVILVGRGTKRIEELLEKSHEDNPQSTKLLLGFDDRYAHHIYAAADFIVMPSRYEPCGLSQLIGMRYGAIPVVRRTGGLHDTVPDIENKNGRGITYDNHDWVSLLWALERAVHLFNAKETLTQIMIRNMSLDFSWDNPAIKYIELYRKAIDTAK